ncbi:MAG: glycoside hydrolase family 9 protein [Chitinispirillales bacterium]|jgi:hypothetical protein|nr:glycoside hydrolase family 9 protein [Chitinispirillales bacterium]
MSAKKIILCAAAAASLCLAQMPAFPVLTDNIVIDQFGYREEAKKIAVVRSPWDCARPSRNKETWQSFPIACTEPSSPYIPGAEFQLINETSGNAALTKAPAVFRGGLIDSASGDKIWHFDFSEIKTPGTYYVLDKTNSLRSFSFRIANNVYNDVLTAAVRMLYYQRAGIEKLARHAGEEWADGMCFEQDKRSRLFTDSTNAAAERDLSGAWFDAGDYNKYTKWTSDYISAMIHIYEENPDVFKDNYNIPESNNGIPDLIDEVKIGLNWLFRMQNEDGSVLSVQGLASGSPPSSVTGRSYYGPANATATFGAAAAFAIAARFFGEPQNAGFSEAGFAQRLETAAVKAWEWGYANPDSMFFNNSDKHGTQGLASGQQEVNDENGARHMNRAAAAYYLYELTGADSLLTIVEADMNEFPLLNWWTDQYRHGQNMLCVRYLENPNGDQAVKDNIRSFMRSAMINNQNDYRAGYAKDGYRAFIRDYNWGSNQYKADYGLTFYKWKTIDPSSDEREFRDMAESYLHYLHGANPFNMVYLTNMGRYGASRSATSMYHTWFYEHSSKWSVADGTNPGPAPGYLTGGPNEDYYLWGCCPSSCGSAANNARCNLVTIPQNLPPAKMYADINHTWPLDTWEITEPMIAYQLAYIRLLSKFVNNGLTSVYNKSKQLSKTSQSLSARSRRGVLELRLNGMNAQSVELFNLRGAKIAVLNKKQLEEGTHHFKTKGFAKQMCVLRVTSADKKTAAMRVRIE